MRDYFLPEQPVLVTDLETPDEQIIQRLLNEHDTSPGLGFVGSTLTDYNDLVVPAIVTAVLSRDDVVVRHRPLRVWMQRMGHFTLLHHDANSLHGMNLHVTGRKHWTLISPDTPPLMSPFHYHALAREEFRPDPRKHRFCELEIGPGEMLFLPRYWLHRVRTLEDRSINLNWVCTPKTPNLDVSLGRRECAVLALRDRIPGLSRLLYQPPSIHNYGEGGETLFQTYSGAIKGWGLWRQLGAELTRAMLLPYFHPLVMGQARKSKETMI